jgi:hypothetical protein
MEPDAIARAQAAFEAGDYRRARTLAFAGVCDGGDAEAAARAQRILEATGVDTVQLGVLLVCLLLLAGVCYHYVLQ